MRGRSVRIGRRWSWLVLGGALMVPFGVLGSLIGALVPNADTRNLVDGLVLAVVVVVSALLFGLLPDIQRLEEMSSRELLGGPLAELPLRDPRVASRSARSRASLWFTLHVLVGGVTSTLVLGAPVVIWLVVAHRVPDPAPVVRAETIGAMTLAAGLALLLAALVGAGLARLAPTFLGPSAADRLAALERQADRLAERGRLARELHDCVGHALSMMTVQAAAAGRVLDSRPDFVRQALTAIEESARAALEDLDHVLGLLREDDDPTSGGARRAPAPTLRELDELIRRTRSAGVELDARIEDVPGAPGPVSTAAYRIVQEGLTNAVRHAPGRPVRLHLHTDDGRLRIELSNPIPGPARTGRPATAAGRDGGGSGLRGISERVAALHGETTAGPRDGEWQVRVSLPLRPGGDR